MAAGYLFHLCQNHAFIDGNKRVGANAAITFLLMNNWEPIFAEEELVDLVLSVASGELHRLRLIEIFESHCKSLEDASRSAADAHGPDGRIMRITLLTESITRTFPDESTASADGFSRAPVAGPPSPE